MRAREIREEHDALIQDIRDFIYSSCVDKGGLVYPGDDEVPYHSLEVDIPLDHNATGLSTLEMPHIVEIRAYLSEGWIYVIMDYGTEPVDIDELYTEDMLNIVESL